MHCARQELPTYHAEADRVVMLDRLARQAVRQAAFRHQPAGDSEVSHWLASAHGRWLAACCRPVGLPLSP